MSVNQRGQNWVFICLPLSYVSLALPHGDNAPVQSIKFPLETLLYSGKVNSHTFMKNVCFVLVYF